MGILNINILSSEDMKNKKDWEESFLTDQLNSTQIDTSQSEPMKTSELITQFQPINSNKRSQESEDIDLCSSLLFLSFSLLFILFIYLKSNT
jgi:hypothetical protein